MSREPCQFSFPGYCLLLLYQGTQLTPTGSPNHSVLLSAPQISCAHLTGQLGLSQRPWSPAAHEWLGGGPPGDTASGLPLLRSEKTRLVCKPLSTHVYL